MRVLAHVHQYPPEHNAGAEWMIHTLMREMRDRGHEVMVISGRARGDHYDFEGVTVLSGSVLGMEGTSLASVYETADVAVTHLDETLHAMRAALETRTPLAHLVHNGRQLRAWNVHPGRGGELAIFNAESCREASKWTGKSAIVPPPVFADEYRTDTSGEFVTLINLNVNKGGELFWELAARMPDVSFLGVLGAYAQQVPPPQVMPYLMPGEKPREWPNVTIASHTSSVVRDVYSRTKLILMPSHSETWGRVAVEAAASGIPSLLSPTPGLLESMTGGATYVPDYHVDTWSSAIREALSPETYEKMQHRALKRSAELDPVPWLDTFERVLGEIAR